MCHRRCAERRHGAVACDAQHLCATEHRERAIGLATSDDGVTFVKDQVHSPFFRRGDA